MTAERAYNKCLRYKAGAWLSTGLLLFLATVPRASNFRRGIPAAPGLHIPRLGQWRPGAEGTPRVLALEGTVADIRDAAQRNGEQSVEANTPRV